MKTLAGIIIGSAALLALSGCAAGDDPAAASAAQKFESALAQGDGEAACTLLTEKARDWLQDESGSACADAILSLGLHSGGAVETARVYGRAAQVQLADDVLFLALDSAGWQVSAAGCTSRMDRPYLCDLEGK